MNNDHDTGDAILVRRMLWLATNDEKWLAKCAKNVEPSVFACRATRFVFAEAAKYWQIHNVPCPFQDYAPLALEKEAARQGVDLAEALAIHARAEPPPENLKPALVDRANEWFRKEQLTRTNLEIADLIADDNVEAAYKLAQDVTGVFAPGERACPRDALADLDLDWEEWSALHGSDADAHAIETGLPKIDRLMNGGIHRRELGVVLGPTNSGKSHMLVMLACEAYRQDQRVLFITLEMPEKAIQNRVRTNLSGIPGDRWAEEFDEVQRRLKVIAESNRIQKGMLHVAYMSADQATVPQIVVDLKQAANEGNAYDLLVIDYGDLIAPTKNHNGNRTNEQAEVFTALQAAAATLDIPIWTACQANRQAHGRSHVGLEHVGNSIDKVRVSDWVLALCQTDLEKQDNTMRVDVVKARSGERGMCEVQVDFACSRFTEI